MENLSELVEIVRQSSRQVIRELGFLENSVFNLGLTHSQCHTLVELDKQGLMTLQELTVPLRLDKSTLSRTVTALVKKGWVKTGKDPRDSRRKPLSLTSTGQKLVTQIHQRSNRQVGNALAVLTEKEQQLIMGGMSLYAKALAQTRKDIEFEVRPIEKSDNVEVARVIRTVLPEFGATGPGYAIHDPEISDMFTAYQGRKSIYFVLIRDGRIVGGAGIAPLQGGDLDTCELRKMYFLSEARGHGYGRKLLELCLKTAKEKGYRRCYLETLERMHQAKRIYEKSGFKKLSKPIVDTGHASCDAWYLKTL